MVNIKWDKRSLIARLHGDIDHHNCKGIREILDCEIDKKRPERLIIDLENVEFMDSSGIGVIMGRYKKMVDCGGAVYFSGINKKIDRLIKLSGLLKIIEPIKEAK